MARRRSVKGIPNVFLWCSKVDKKKQFRYGAEASGLNCVVKVEGYKKCTWDGKPAKCVETAFMYEIEPGRYPKYRKRK